MVSVLLEHLSFRYSNFSLSDISFEVSAGEFFSIVGPNGSGKTTLLKLIDGLLSPQQGRLQLFGKDIRRLKRSEVARIAAFVRQEGAVVFPFTVYEVVMMGRAPHLALLGFDSEEDRKIVHWAMGVAQVSEIANRLITEISEGERQRTYVARALAQEPGLLLLDEPHAHLDIAHQISLYESLRHLARTRQLAVIAVAHDLNLASMFSDRMLLLKDGKVAAVGKVDEVMTSRLISEAFNVPVIIDKHPLVNTPRVTLTPSNGIPDSVGTNRHRPLFGS